MKLLLAAIVALIIGTGYSSISSPASAADLMSFQTNEPPATGNDSEDTSERGLMCRLFGYFC